jgi:cell wall-associated NlpC family hydrolase
MDKYICENVFVPLRSGPTHRSEMVSQILFGEKYTITDTAGSWIKIESMFDNYSGWIDTDHLQHSADTNGSEGKVLNRSLLCFRSDKTKMVLEAGCVVYDPNFKEGRFTTGNNVYTTTGEFSAKCIGADESVSETALKFINSPYIWGGRIPSGIDCSGFTQLIYKLHGIKLSRNSRQQAEQGRPVDFINDALPGDLVFFDNENRIITHVGMILAQGLVIHASGRVRIDSIDHQGIFKKEINGYSHKLRMIRRIL